jgi:signal transduction histidine kinase
VSTHHPSPLTHDPAGSRRRAIVDPVTLVAIAAIGLAVGVFAGGWRPFQFLKKAPPTAQLTQLQADLAAAQAQAEAARRDHAAATAAERAKLEAQVRAAQQDAAGTQAALARVPAEHRTAEVRLAGAMAQRVSLKLAAAIGALPADQQQAMIELIDQALSDKQAEVDEAMRRLAQRDAEFATLARERDTVRAMIPVLEQRVANAEQTAKATQSEVTQKTNEVKIWATAKDQAERQAGGFAAQIDRIWRIFLWIAGGYLFLAYILPGLVKHLDAGPLKTFLRDVSGYTTSGLLYHDAKKKLGRPSL